MNSLSSVGVVFRFLPLQTRLQLNPGLCLVGKMSTFLLGLNLETELPGQ